MKFKEEYESLNGTIGKSGKKTKSLSISEDNPIKYASYDEVLDVIEKELERRKEEFNNLISKLKEE